MINSRNKGSKNERNLAKLWKSFTGKDFTKTPSSGGLGWKRKADTSGDIICTDEKHSRYFAFSIETKFYKEINFNHLLLDVKSDILEFWAQATEDANKAKKTPILFMRYNGMPRDLYYIVMTLEVYDQISVLMPETHKRLIVVVPANELAIVMSTEFFKIPYEALHKLVKQINKDTHGK